MAYQVHSLDQLADELLSKAPTAHASRSAKTVQGGGGKPLGQTMIALDAGTTLGEHTNPGAASVLVVRGRVGFDYDGKSWTAKPYELFEVPEDGAYTIKAIDRAVILLTIARQIH